MIVFRIGAMGTPHEDRPHTAIEIHWMRRMAMRDEDMIFSEMAAEADEERAAEDAYAEQCAKDELERQAHGDDLIVRSDLVVIYDEPDPMGLVDLSKCEGKHARFMLMAMARQRGDRMLGGYTEEVVRALLAAHPELMKRNDDPFEGVA